MKKRLIAILSAVIVTFTAFSIPAQADYYTESMLLKYGQSSNEVRNLQNDLKRLGYFNANSTGYFGTITKQSVMAYQSKNNLVVDGIVGRNTAREIKIDRVLKTAKSYLGVPYVWGGASPSGFDCSGFVYYALLQNGIVIPRTTELQYNVGTWVNANNLKQGDLVFFSTYRAGPSHVGIYLGNDNFIQASSGSGKITISKLFSNPYFSQHYIGAKRVIN